MDERRAAADGEAALPPERLLQDMAWLRRLAGRLVVDGALADDVAQQTLLAALQHSPGDDRRPRAWLATVARHVAATFGRERQRREKREESAARDLREPSSHDVVEKAALQHAVAGAVLALGEPYRTALLRHWFDGAKPSAIAREQDLPVETVRTRLKRGLELLRAELVARRALPGGIVALVALLSGSARAAATKAIAAAASGGAGAAGGAIAMAAQAKAGLAVTAVLLVAVIAGWWATSTSRSAALDRAPLLAADERAVGAEGARAGAVAPVAARAAERSAGEAGAAARAVIRGVVLTEVGAPIERARVGLLPPVPSPPLPGRSPQRAPEFALAEPAVLSGADGRFELPLSSPSTDAAMPESLDVAAVATGWLPAVWRRAAPGDEIVLILPRGVTLSGRVRDLDGRPVGGAEVCWRYEGTRRHTATARSAADGTFRFADVVVMRSSERDEQGLPWLDVRADGYATLTLMAWGNLRELDRDDYECDLWLMRGATARGRVIDLATGAPIAGADVWLEPWDDDVPTTLHTISARDGTFVLAGLPAWGVTLAGQYGPDLSRRRLGELCAQAPERGRACSALDLPDDGAELDVTLALPRLGGVRGRVVDEAGRPVAGAVVYSVGKAGGQQHDPEAVVGRGGALPRTDIDGRYELAGLALADGEGTRAPLNGSLELGAWEIGRIAPQSVALMADRIVEAPELVLSFESAIVVEIVDAGGWPVAEACVAIAREREGELRVTDTVHADRSGRAVFIESDLPEWFRGEASIAPTLHVAAEGFAPASVPFAPDAERRVRVVMEPEHRLFGRIVDRDGAAGGGFLVALPASVMEADEFAAALRVDRFWKLAQAQQAARADVPIGVGRFVLRGLDAGPWHVAVLRGWDAAGRGSQVELTGPHVEGAEAVLVIDGSAQARATIEPAAAATLTGSAEIMLTYASTGRPVFRAGQVSLRAGDKMHEARPTAPGVFVCEQVPAGRWNVVVDAPGAARATAPLEIVADQRATVALTLAAGIVARGRIGLAALPPFSKAHLFFVSDDGGGSAHGELATDGSYVIPGLVDGKSYCRWMHLALEGDAFAFRVPAGPAEAAEAADAAARSEPVEWLPAGCLAVRFLRDDLLGSDATLRIRDESGAIVYERTPVNRWGVDRVLPFGRYTLELTIPGRSLESREATLDQPSSEPVYLLLEE